MTNQMASFDALAIPRIEAIAKELAAYGLGITMPHAHDEEGEIIPLPLDVTVSESDLKVSFVPQNQVPENSVAVGWRWDGEKMVVFANCCTRV